MKKARQILALLLTILMTTCSVDIVALANEMPDVSIQTEWTEPLESGSEDIGVFNSEQADDDDSGVLETEQAPDAHETKEEIEHVLS